MKFRPFSSKVLIAGGILFVAKPGLAQGASMFPEVPPNHWAYESVKVLKEAGILEGYPAPKRPGARPTFHAPATASAQQDVAFMDLPTSHWAYATMAALQQRDILRGYPTDYFSRRLLTRYELAVATRRMLDHLFGAHAKCKCPPSRPRTVSVFWNFWMSSAPSYTC
jgi:hypothetical protein